ncbi:cell division cycle 7-related protein kinase isoform X2 [Teleopsis dalmanni]|uniref:cell division cycle 7-related protein kinase isoform X2 n=1 Tax=Teleopsis dalmanni TaxID=139649 RepID=UPI0018CF0296|nr:cell division cycle 7-related protein kinase isoform X2 [Teleopsis dalmanni]
MAKVNAIEKKSHKIADAAEPTCKAKSTAKKLNEMIFHATKSKVTSPLHNTHRTNHTICKYTTQQLAPTLPNKGKRNSSAKPNHSNNKNTEKAVEQVKGLTPEVAASMQRSKNEEAVSDLLTRIPEISNIFDVHSRIGNGTFSTVLLATMKREKHLPDHLRKKYAIKHHIPTSHPDRIKKELQCMATMGGTNNVIGINCCIRFNESVAFIMPYIQHDRFHDFYTKMNLEEIKMYMKNLLIALQHVHKFSIIHRDVKPSNFLYNRRKGQFLLVDFGLAQHVPPPQQLSIDSLTLGNSEYQLLAIPGTTGESKRQREIDGSNGKCETEAPPKRIRMGPQGDHPTSSVTSGNSPKVATIDNTGQFKMPLKQLNEISTNAKPVVNNSNLNLIYETPPGNEANTAASKYITNRNLISSNVAKCSCYGHPKVCNICLVKKEMHASRAGTPGYRPPEVLLKYLDQTTAVDIWAAGVILLSVMSSVYPFFKAPNDYVALAEMVTIFGDKCIRRTAFALDRLVTLSQRSKPLDLRKLCVRFRNRAKFSSTTLLEKYRRVDGSCEICKNCDQFYFNCLCLDSNYNTEPLDKDDDMFPASAYDLLLRLLEVNPHKRITAEEALNHPFFESLKNSSTSPKPIEDDTHPRKDH